MAMLKANLSKMNLYQMGSLLYLNHYGYDEDDKVSSYQIVLIIHKANHHPKQKIITLNIPYYTVKSDFNMGSNTNNNAHFVISKLLWV